MNKKRYAVICVLFLICVVLPAQSTTAKATSLSNRNLLLNGDFEYGNVFPSGWLPDAWQTGVDLSWEPVNTFHGSRSVKIASVKNSYARWAQQVPVQPNTEYRLSGYIKTENVLATGEGSSVGAYLLVENAPEIYNQTVPLQGTNDWTMVSLTFNSSSQTSIYVFAMLDNWGNSPPGIAWFDLLVLEPVAVPTLMPNQLFMPLATNGLRCNPTTPAWQILVNVYESTDFTYTDKSGKQRHLVASITQAEKNKVAYATNRFFSIDVPTLNNCIMLPEVIVRFISQPLTKLTALSCSDYAPTPGDATPDRSSGFDSVISIWDGSGTDLLSGESVSIQGCGYAWSMGTGQMYDAIPIDFVSYQQQNIFKHEWGHSILFYFKAAGLTPNPAVDNHINDTNTRYVNCLTGQPYVLKDQNDLYPIPNSIYNNETGFTHDYYSGFTATADRPGRCLGISPAAWSAGGPVTRPNSVASARSAYWRSTADDVIGIPVPFLQGSND